ncbi:unnamed protein product, partial [Ranitomeya imitator]
MSSSHETAMHGPERRKERERRRKCLPVQASSQMHYHGAGGPSKDGGCTEAEMKVSDEHCASGSSIFLKVDKDNMQVPCSLVNFKGGGAIFISYKVLNTRLNGSILAALGDSDNRSREDIISSVVGGIITSDKTQNLGSPVRFTLKHMM